MTQTSRIYVTILCLSTALVAITGIVGSIAAEQLPSWLEPIRPWAWPLLLLLLPATVAVLVLQYRLEGRGAPIPQPAVYHNLKQPDYSTFLDRKQELEELRRILRPYPHSQEHLVSIDGVGGIGKSTLALETAHRFLREYDRLPKDERFDAIVWSSAKPAVLTGNGIVRRAQASRTLEDLYTDIATTLERQDITRVPPDEQPRLVIKALAEQRTLLIVDNLETVDDERVNAFLRELPAPTKAIVTTRHRIDVAYPMRLLEMPWEEARTLISLHCEKKGVSLTEEEHEKLYQRTGGVPLALVWSIAQIAYGESAEAVLVRLGNPQGDVARFCFQASVDSIGSATALQLLLALAMFANDASREAVGYVAGLGDDVLSRDESLVALEKLSLVTRRSGRFSLLPLTRAYALSLCTDDTALRLRQEEFFLGYCHLYAGSTRNWAHYPKIDMERKNLIDLMEWCRAKQRWQSVLDFQDQLREYWEFRGYWSEQEKWCSQALEAFELLPVHAKSTRVNNCKKGRLHLSLCWVRINQDRFDEACAEADKAMKIFELMQDKDGLAVAHRHLGLTEKLWAESQYHIGRLDSAQEGFALARRHYETALQIWQELGNRREASSILGNLGHLLIAEHRHAEARDFLERALTIRRDINDTARIATTLRGLGWIDELEGKLGAACCNYQEALETARRVAEPQSVGESLLGLASIALQKRKYTEAHDLATEALALFDTLNETAFLLRDISRAMDIVTRARKRAR